MWSMIANCMLRQKAYTDKTNMVGDCISPSFGNKQEECCMESLLLLMRATSNGRAVIVTYVTKTFSEPKISDN